MRARSRPSTVEMQPDLESRIKKPLRSNLNWPEGERCGFERQFFRNRAGRTMRYECIRLDLWRSPRQVAADVEAVDAGRGRAPDPRNHGAQGHRREAGQYPHRDGVRKMRHAQSHLGGKRRNAGEIRLQAMRAEARDAVNVVIARSQRVRPLARPDDKLRDE